MELKDILKGLKEKKITPEQAKEEIKKLNSNYKSNEQECTPQEYTANDQVIAIIGISGRYPNASNIQEYWNNLEKGINGVREIPNSRWNLEEYYDPDKNKEGKFYCKWMGMLDDIECFDSLFFEIPPSEAESMDPQHRLFLQEGYKAFEDAGYSRTTLNNKKCGVYLGIINGEYSGLSKQNGVENNSITGSSNAIGVARIAYYLNLKGPAIPIDTACSSSLVSTHLAIQSLVNGEIEMALVGGVSLYIDPESYVGMCSAGMLSPDGKCKAFDNEANGFVPGESVGAIVLKRLKDAQADHDHIYGVIIGSNINQDGRTNGITAPNLGSQIQLARDLYDRYNINPETISYAELHGTGTKLGDPIELEALSTAFKEKTDRKNFCEIGSVKNSIGHTSAAAAMASIHKVLLCMQNKKLVPTLNVTKLNEHFDFKDSPFHVNTETKPWEQNGPYRASVSAFGYSGTNAQAVIESYDENSYPATGKKVIVNEKHKGVFLLSARNKTQLNVYVKNMQQYVKEHMLDMDLSNVLYTLQVGREAMEERLAILISTSQELLDKLNEYLSQGTNNKDIFESKIAKKVIRLKESMDNCIPERNTVINNEILQQLVDAWLKGEKVAWERIYEGCNIRKVSLPTYPFEKEKHWFTKKTNKVENKKNTFRLHALVHENISDFEEQHFRSVFEANELIFEEHQINNQKLLPGVAVLEMVRAAAQLSGNKAVKSIMNVIWCYPIQLRGEKTIVDIHLYPEDNETVHFEITIPDENEDIICAEGTVSYKALKKQEEANEFLKYTKRCNQSIEPKVLYESMSKNGIVYGKMFKTLEKVHYNEKEVIAYIKSSTKQDEYMLAPGLLDGALQTVSLLIRDTKSAYVPFTAGKIEIYKELRENAYVHTQYIRENKGIKYFDVTIVDEQGNLIANITDFSVKELAKARENKLMYFEPYWELEENKQNDKVETVIIFDDLNMLKQSLMESKCVQEIIHIKSGTQYEALENNIYTIRPLCIEDYIQLFEALNQRGIHINHIIYNWTEHNKQYKNVEQEIDKVLNITKGLLRFKLLEHVKLLYVYCHDKDEVILEYEAMEGLFNTIKAENPLLMYKVIELIGRENLNSHVTQLIKEFAANEETAHIRLMQGERWIKGIKQVKEQPINELNHLIQNNASYLITGGLGGLGLIFADYLSRKVKANLILVGRRAPKAEDLEKIKALEANGAQVLYISADISKKEDVERVVLKSKERFGRIDGVLQCAGVIRDALIVKKQIEDIQAVLAPKVYGTQNLDEVLKDEKLKFFVVASSLASMLGNIGQCDYCYANSFMDHFAIRRQKLVNAGKRYGKTVSINWPFWKEGGMAIDKESLEWMGKKTGIKALETREGIVAFETSLRFDKPQVLVFNGNEKIIQNIFDQTNKKQIVKSEHKLENVNDIDQKTLRIKTLDYLKEVLAQKTKIAKEKIDVSESFDVYGIDSILVMSLTRTLEEQFGELSKTLFYEYNSLEELVEYFLESKSELLIEKFSVKETKQPEALEEKVSYKRKRFSKTKAERSATLIQDDKEEQDIAIIGISGRYPMADNLDEFWENLKVGKDCITEIPKDRWDYHKYYDKDKNKVGKTYGKWGGFINNIDSFDALFFNIPPIDAEMLDPQTRLFLQTTWEAMEDAGYTRKSLSDKKVGVFVGVMYGMYELFEGNVRGERVPIGSSYATIANRVSYFCDFTGPSMAIDTMCSSSLTALHLGCESIKRGESDLVVVGGVNVTIHPNKYILLSLGKFISTDGRCRSFGEGGDGYVPGEGVGAVLLKPLQKAIEDQDHIYGIIKATAINSGGKTSGFTVPSPNAQAQVITETLEKAHIKPSTVSYIETHGTGTSLGDPIEIKGLTKAFKDDAAQSRQYCAIGSVKSNIGHLESVAGIAALTKVILQMKHKQLVPSIHSATLNPFINFKETPFYVLQQLEPWKEATVEEDGQIKTYPRRAGISSFGAGGSNAHVIIEEYVPSKMQEEKISNKENIYVVSAKNKERLEKYIRLLTEYITTNQDEEYVNDKLIRIVANQLGITEKEIDSHISLSEYGMDIIQLVCIKKQIAETFNVLFKDKEENVDVSISQLAQQISKQLKGVNKTLNAVSVAYTLQVGREAMEERVAVIAESLEEFISKLNAYLNREENIKGLYTANILDYKVRFNEMKQDENYEASLKEMLHNRALDKLAQIWIMGAEVDWRELYDKYPFKISLPTYPFAQERYWAILPENNDVVSTTIHPLIDYNTSNIEGLRFSKTFTGDEPYLRDHIIKGSKILPGVVYLEMIRAALASAFERSLESELCIRNIVWLVPVQVNERHKTIDIELRSTSQDEINFTIYSKDGDSKIIHCKGNIVSTSRSLQGEQEESINMMQSHYQDDSIKGEKLYKFFENSGIQYGESHQVIQEVYYGKDGLLTKLQTQDTDLAGYVMIPGILDGALQATIGLLENKNVLEGKEASKSEKEAEIPFAIGEVKLLKACKAQMWAKIALKDKKINIHLYDEQDNLCVILNDILFRSYQDKQQEHLTSAKMLFVPKWHEKAITSNKVTFKEHIIVLCEAPDEIIAKLEENDYKCINLVSSKSLEGEKYQDYVSELLDVIKQQMKALKHKVLIQLFIEKKAEHVLLEGLSGLLKTVHMENNQVCTQVIEYTKAYDAQSIIKDARDNANDINSEVICYEDHKRLVKELVEVPALENQMMWEDKKVYLITGGVGGLGYIIARDIIKHTKHSKIVLTGRSAFNETIGQKIASLESKFVTYMQVDITHKEAVTNMVQTICNQMGNIDVMIHCAGINRDSLIINKDVEELQKVLAPKVLGVSYLNEATKDLALDYFICFSSMAGMTGNIGQVDYAAANGFMDMFAAYRNEQMLQGACKGHTLSINWPYWLEGGMRVEENVKKAIYENTGLVPMDTEVGLTLLHASIRSQFTQVMPLEGNKEKIEEYLFKQLDDNQEEAAIESQTTDVNKGELERKLIVKLKQILSQEIKLDIERIDPRVPLEVYGINSIMVIDLTTELEKIFGPLPTTLFFEYQTLKELAQYLSVEYTQKVVECLGIKNEEIKPVAQVKKNKTQVINQSISQSFISEVKPNEEVDEIAIIGLAGQYPQADNLEEFWDNLTHARDCVTEIPTDRWDHSIYYDSDKTKPNKTYAKWGGFLKDVKSFDALFFNISPGEAEVMDPQERLFLQCVYHAIEDSGYTRQTLSENTVFGLNNAVGVFVGVMYEEYQLYAAQAQAKGQMITVNGSAASIANRISYFCGFHGPSIAIDTMCSSSLTAIHLACQSIKDGECEVAVAGGVNLSVHPNKYLMLGKNRFMSSKGRCESFGKDGDGYTPGEGVGAIILKSKAKAILDGDHIYGVIKSTAINHGGKTNGYTVPNPPAQASVIKHAIHKAHINPRAISYVEAHGTGTALGDPIEIMGLSRAFREGSQDNQFCYIGSVKSNIGHCESAGGMAAITKVLLQMKHEQIVPSIHSKTLNPNINFKESPFMVPQELIKWQRPIINENGIETRYPLISGISAFGAGGTNVHIILEEYIEDKVEKHVENSSHMILLSARNVAQLKEQVEQLINWIQKEKPSQSDLTSIAYTLQVGREHMEKRLAFVVNDIDELVQGLKDYLLGNGNYYVGEVKGNSNILDVFESDEELQGIVYKWFEEGKYAKLLEFWVKGLALDWRTLYKGEIIKRISLPTYPFARKAYWIPDAEITEDIQHVTYENIAKIHPLLHENISDFFEQKYKVIFDGIETFFRDHIVGGNKILPAVVYIEMVSTALIHAMRIDKNNIPNIEFKDLTWLKALCIEDQQVEVYVSLETQENMISFKVYSMDQSQENIYCTGKVKVCDQSLVSKVVIPELQQACNQEVLDKAQIYTAFEKININYGKTQQALEKLYIGDQKILAHMVLPKEIESEMQKYRLYPAMMDAALQAAMGMETKGENATTKLPFMIEKITVIDKCSSEMYAYIVPHTKDSEVLDINIYDAAGNLCIEIKAIYYKAIKTGLTNDKKQLMFVPTWEKTAIRAMKNEYSKQIVILSNMSQERYAAIANQLTDKTCVLINASDEEELAYSLKDVFENIKKEINTSRKLHIQVLVNKESTLVGVSALLKTAHLENPNIYAQVIQLDYAQSDNRLIELINENSQTEDEVILYNQDIRYCKKYKKVENEDKFIPWVNSGVYLITGGLGGLGKIFTKEIISKVSGATIILTGRSILSDEHILDELQGNGTKVVYKSTNICNKDEVEKLIAYIQENYGKLNGIIHSAGIVRDNFIYKKKDEEFLNVIAPKVKGIYYLDEATKDMQVDFFVTCSSLSAVTGNVGQADYAVANAIMDEFMRRRQKLIETDRRSGLSKSINWPLWKEGGLQIDEELEKAMMNRTGMCALETSSGLELFYGAMAQNQTQVIALTGKEAQVEKLFVEKNKEAEVIVTEEVNDLHEDTLKLIKDAFSKVLKMPSEEIIDDELLERYGIDSIMIMKVTEDLEKKLGALPKTLLFEYQTIIGITDYLVENMRDALAKLFNKQETVKQVAREIKKDEVKPVESYKMPLTFKNKMTMTKKVLSTNDEIAIIGISGAFAKSENLKALWQNLEQGKDCISEVPKSRWDHSKYFNPDKNNYGTVYTKWGGFMERIDCFDPLFFNISPRDAVIMDPQERLFMETAYAAMEDAGYTRQSLGYNPGGEVRRKVGVFVGAMNEEYQLHAAQQQLLGNPVVASGNLASIANRISYFCDFHGPSVTLDTMCSSSLVAVQMACQSINEGDCEVALAGGVNVISHPNKYLTMSQSRFASTNGRCMAFGKGGDGYVAGEGVGAIILKSKNKAIEDGDHIYGVIKGIAVNHGGKTNGYTVPNPVAQRDVITTALEKAQIDAKTISYIEAHGTGTSLGDPIEINALDTVFKKHTDKRKYCAIGSIKSNVGHCESASGMASVAKVLLQMKYKKIVPSLHSSVLNPNINFEDSIFFVPQKVMNWDKLQIEEEGQMVTYPRRAGISAFGAGGTNVHMIIEEYSDNQNVAQDLDKPVIIVLSAKNEERLEKVVKQLLEALNNEEVWGNLSDIAYTLQVGREAMEERIAFVVSSIEELKEQLVHYPNNDVYRGVVYNLMAHAKPNNKDIEEVKEWVKIGAYDKICESWIKGKLVNWQLLYVEGHMPKRVSLPTYPFEKQAYWIALKNKPVQLVGTAKIASLVHENTSNFYEQKFISRFSGEEAFLRDHRIGERKVLPGTAILEMVRQAAQISEGRPVECIKDVIWLNQIEISSSHPVEVVTKLMPVNNSVDFEVSSISASNPEDIKVCSKGSIKYRDTDEPAELIDIEAIRKSCNSNVVDGTICYTGMEQNGLINGESFRVIKEIQYNEGEAIANLSIPSGAVREDFILDPSLLNGAFQAVVTLMNHVDEQVVFLPFVLSNLKIYSAITDECVVYISSKKYNDISNHSIYKFDMIIANHKGEILGKLKEFTLKAFEIKPKENVVTKYYIPRWHEQIQDKYLGSEKVAGNEAIIIFDSNKQLYKNVKEVIQEKGENKRVILVLPGKAYCVESEHVFRMNMHDREDYKQFIEQLKEWQITSLKIIFYKDTDINNTDINDRIEEGIYALFDLSQELMLEKVRSKVNLIFAFTNQKDEIIPEYSAISGFARIIHMENPEFSYKTVELYKPEYNEDAYNKAYEAEVLLNEFNQDENVVEVRYEGQKRLIRELYEL